MWGTKNNDPTERRIIAIYTGERGWEPGDRGLRFTCETAELLSAQGGSMVRVRLGLTRVRDVSTTGSRALR